MAMFPIRDSNMWDTASAFSEPSSSKSDLIQIQVQDQQTHRPLSFLQRVLTRRRSSPQSVFDAHGSLGLNLLFCPAEPLLDLVFVHGLGGGSTKTWCSSADATQFWPKAWLPREAGFRNIRIHSYGYDADWQSTKASPTINVHDFGHQLLERLRNCPHVASSRTGPIVFVAHSMGGLVVKQAYVLARQDPSLADLAKRIEAMVFLATPHRGSDLAQTLNSILRASAGTRPTRSYISNLSHQNELLSLLNDSFRHYATDVSLYSFYESRPTELYVRSEMIVTKDSAVLGYPHERHAMLDADHRQVCKFESPSDPNYAAVREALRSMTETILGRLSAEHVQETWREMRQIESFLAMPARPDDDLKDVEEARIAGSCEWLADNKTFQRWADPESEDASVVYWISANPATGKSVLSGYVVNSLADLSLDCSYYFFRHGDKDKSTVSGFLRSLLYQMALRSAQVRQQLLAMIEKAVRYNKDDSRVIWRKLAWPIICNTAPAATSSSNTITNTNTVHYWVLDALDECSGFEALFMVMAHIERHARIRILITSRKLPEITQRFAELRRNPAATIAVCAEEVSVEDTKADIRLYLEGNRYKLHVGNEEQKDAFSNRVLEKSEGCFLWVRIVLDELASAWSVGQVQRILDEVPREMGPLYSRALAIMSSRPRPSRDLARAILTWIVCSVRPLTVAELSEALKLDLDDEVPELEVAIASLCAQLVHIDKTGRAMIVHLTAKTFLTDDELESEFRIDEKLGHLRLSTSCLRFLCSDQMKLPRAGGRRRAMRKQQAQCHTRPPFTAYACLEFAEHLRHATSANTALSSLLYSFLGANVLSWIEYVAAAGNLSILTRTANSINPYLQRHIQSSSPLGEFVHLTQNWVVDLHRIVAGFGSNLLAYPWGIYWLVPPFCPKSSAIVATAGSRFSRITVRGLRDEGWNDRMSCIDTHDTLASAVACGDTIFAVGYNPGPIVLHHNSTCLPWKTLEHGSPVRHLLFDDPSTHLISAGRRDVKVWKVDSGFVCWAAELGHDIMDLAVTEDGKTVMAADKGSSFTAWSMRSGEVQPERTLNWGEKTPFPDEGRFRRPPLAAALSPDASLLGVLYRGRPVCLYDLEDDGPHGLVSRDGEDPMAQGLGSNLSPMTLVFNTKRDSPTLAVAYEDGDLCLFDYEELRLLVSVPEANAHSLACSPDGLTLVTGNSNGMVQLLEFDTLHLIYRVNAADYGIRGLAFSADNLRFLDVRGTQCNVWEPAVLLGMAKRDESLTEPAEWEPIIKGIDSDDVDITSMIELDDSEQYFFVGRSDGSVSLFETASGEQRKVLYRHNYQISVTATVWGSQKRVIVSSDTACRFMVFVLLPDPPLGGWKIAAKLMDRRADSMVLQLLLDPSNRLLLVSTEKSNSVWNLKTRQLLGTQPWQPPPSFCWINHPGSPAHRILITTTTAAIVDWEPSNTNSNDNNVVASTDLLQTIPDSHEAPSQPQRVKNAFAFAQGKFLAVELSLLYEERATTDTMLFRLLPSSDPQKDGSFLTAAGGFSKLGKSIRHVIGACGSRLLFLDARRWVCSVDANGIITAQGDSDQARHYVRHFPIPSEWQSQQRRLYIAATRKGDILFVRANEVAIISRGLEFEERLAVEGG